MINLNFYLMILSKLNNIFFNQISYDEFNKNPDNLIEKYSDDT